MRRFQFSIAAMMFVVVYAALSYKVLGADRSIIDLIENQADTWAEVRLIYLNHTLEFCDLLVAGLFFAKGAVIFTRRKDEGVFWLGCFLGMLALSFSTLEWHLHFVAPTITVFLLQHPGAILGSILIGFFVQWVYSRSVEPQTNGTSTLT